MRRRLRQRPTDLVKERDTSKRTPAKEAVLAVLAKQKMLPAIWFIFSRMGCDRAAVEAGEGGSLLSRMERRSVQMHLDALRCSHWQPDQHTSWGSWHVWGAALSSCAWMKLWVVGMHTWSTA